MFDIDFHQYKTREMGWRWDWSCGYSAGMGQRWLGWRGWVWCSQGWSELGLICVPCRPLLCSTACTLLLCFWLSLWYLFTLVMVDNDLLWHCTIAAFTINFVTSAEVITLCSYLCLFVCLSAPQIWALCTTLCALQITFDWLIDRSLKKL